MAPQRARGVPCTARHPASASRLAWRGPRTSRDEAEISIGFDSKVVERKKITLDLPILIRTSRVDAINLCAHGTPATSTTCTCVHVCKCCRHQAVRRSVASRPGRRRPGRRSESDHRRAAARSPKSLCRRVDRQILTITAVIGQASGIAAPDSARERTAGPRAPSSRASHIRQEARRIPGWRGCDHHLHLCGSCGASAAASCALRSLLSTFSLEGPPAYFMKYGRARLVGRGVQPPSVRPVGCSHD